MSQPLVTAIILNTNHREDTLECLASLAKSTYTNLKVLVLDNASTDGSVEAIHATFPAVDVLQLSENLGYAGNNNIGIEAALAHGAGWVFVLNEDTVLHPDCVTQLIAAGETDQEIGIVGPMVYHHDEPSVIQSAGGILSRFWVSSHLAQNEPDKGQYHDVRPVDWISGCAILVRSAAIQQVGAIDERYFYFWEETEWCLRVRKAGWRIAHIPQAKLWHKGVRREYKPKPQVTYYGTRNHLLTLSKHSAPAIAWIATWLQIGRTLTSWTVKPKWRSMREHRHAMWRGVLDFLSHRWGGPVEL